MLFQKNVANLPRLPFILLTLVNFAILIYFLINLHLNFTPNLKLISSTNHVLLSLFHYLRGNYYHLRNDCIDLHCDTPLERVLNAQYKSKAITSYGPGAYRSASSHPASRAPSLLELSSGFMDMVSYGVNFNLYRDFIHLMVLVENDQD